MKKFEEKTIISKNIFNGKIINVQVDEVILPDGKKGTREIVNHPGAVGIIPITDNQKILFVEQYRKPLEKSIIEIPAGRLEDGEKPEITAIRELEEETGYTTNSVEFITSFYTSPGFANEIIYLYKATEIEKLAIQTKGDEDEFVDVLALSFQEAKQYVRNKQIHDAKTMYAILYLEMLGLK